MRRREFIGLVGGAGVWPFAARAQQPVRVWTVGYSGANTASFDSRRASSFARRLRELGWIEGRTIAIEYRWAEGRNERFAEISAEFVRLKVDVIVAGAAGALAAKQATSVIPIVFACTKRDGTARIQIAASRVVWLWAGRTRMEPLV
jgi:putative ABC transport system substrate-binding protein